MKTKIDEEIEKAQKSILFFSDKITWGQDTKNNKQMLNEAIQKLRHLNKLYKIKYKDKIKELIDNENQNQ